MEDRIVTQFRQALSEQISAVDGRIGEVGGEKMISQISGKVESGIKEYMGELVNQAVNTK